jgi:L-ascorbate metabolism protein UlaG (beta-lactamase superfamily)
MKLQFLGHSCFIIEIKDIRIIIDPFLTGNALATQTVNDLKKIDFIFLTHGHADHVGDALAIAQQYHAKIYANPELCKLLALQSPQTSFHPFAFGGFIDLSFGKVKMTPALHTSSVDIQKTPQYGGLAGGFIFELEGKKLYHAGDTGLSKEMELLKKYKIDIALLPIGGNYTMDIEDTNQAIEMIAPQLVIPMHYNTFDLIKTDPHLISNPFGQTKVLEINEILEF